MGNPYKAKSRKKSAPTPEPVEEKLVAPEGTIGAVLTWVGEDKDRAEVALEQEKAEDRPRKSLTAQLEEILDD